MLIVRPARIEDLDAFCALAEAAGPGFTSLQVPREDLEKRLKRSVESFAGASVAEPGQVYVLMLEDTKTGEVVGCSAVKAKIGIEDPYFNFRVLKVAQKSAVTNRRYDMDVLVLVNECGGCSEVGTLFVREDYRGGPSSKGVGAGRLISQARYMLIAADRKRFSDTIVAELRGHVEADGFSPFWEAIGRKFFQMDFAEADQISAQKDNQFILDLMPKYPIYASLLPQAAQDVIGKTHPKGRGARALLEQEGFRFMDVVDIFDAGPLMSAPVHDLRTLKESRLLEVREDAGTAAAGRVKALVSNDRVRDYRALHTTVNVHNLGVDVPGEALKALDISPGHLARVWHK
jgi:arginine N-succinyltransferase